jgi:hypothetical protein
MRLLVDTDAFCKLAVGGVLEDAVSLLGANLYEDCGRLPALPHMLRRGRLRRTYGAEVCDSLSNMTNSVAVIVQPADTWLDRLTHLEDIDPGEAQIFAAAAEHGMIVVSGDKRALRTLKNVADFASVLHGRIVVLEAALLALCNHLGPDEVRRRIQPLIAHDQVVKVCFSNPGSDPRDGLRSYFDNLVAELAPLVLWSPLPGGGA